MSEFATHNNSSKEIEIWKKKLLDLGKRNNLVNYRDTKSSTLEIVFPDFSTAFKKIVATSSVQVFDDKSEDYDFDDEDEEEIKKLSKSDYIFKYSRRMPASQILLFNAYKPAKKILRSLMKKASDSINERGVNILYAAFGFVEWFDSENTKFRYKAPVLMVPLVIINESINSPIYINQFDEDISVNPTLKYMLENQYGIVLPEYNDQDPKSYLYEVEMMVSKLKWNVLHEAKITTFAFNKLSMYLDLENNAHKIISNPNVKLLTDAEVAESDVVFSEAEFEEVSKSRDLFAKQHNVVDADFSQTEAIEFAMMGKSFVLQGPPGTGKSQTITNMIAELIYAGKKVLFVSEKMAALEVVYNNLKKAKLSDYCLQLHSYKANKRDFLDDLYNTLQKSKTVVNYQASENLDSLLAVKDRLNKYEEKLYKVHQPINMSLYQLIGLTNHLDKVSPVPYIYNDITSLDNEMISSNIVLLRRYTSYEQSIGYNYKNFELYGLDINDFSFSFVNSLKESLTQLIESTKTLFEIIDNSKEVFKANINSGNLLRFADFIKFASENFFFDKSLYNNNLLVDLLNEIETLKSLSASIKKNRETISSKYKDEFFDIDAAELYKRYKEEGSSLFKRIFSSKYKELNSNLISYRKTDEKVQRTEILDDLSLLITLNEEVANYDSHKTIVNCGLAQYKGMDTDWDNLKSLISQLSDFIKSNPEFKEADLNTKYINGYFEHANETVTKREEAVNNLINYFDKEIFDPSVLDRHSIIKLEQYRDNLDKVDLWVEFLHLLTELKRTDLIGFVNMFVDRNRPLNELEDTYKLVCYKQWIDFIFKNDQELYGYSRFLHETDIRSFGEKDKKQLDISKAKINEKLSNKRPDPMLTMPGSPVGILMHEHEKKRKLKPIRLLMKEIPEFIQNIKPCFLMSPLSVSTFLSDNIQFDVTIFDEASQVFPEDAIVAIYRSKQLIVVGDSKQMPPSKFFMTADFDDDEYDEEASDIDSYESILDLCSTAFPTKSLLCHYRSRDESLITFSNKNFYKYNLLTYPSVHEKQDGLGIDFTYLSDGVMDSKTKINIREAEQVVDMVYEHFRKYPNRSLGVVAFNIRQQDAILKLLDKRRAEDPSLEDFFKSDKEEPFFVKNLETVQGDERDTIIFSVTYAKNDKGQFALRFGPLNMVGGERRLNVAITRAKLNVKVISSIKAIDIDVSRVSNEGPKLLHDYLDYAEHGMSALDRAISVDDDLDFDSPFELDVYEFLCSQGFEVTTQVGCSKYRIDLALKRPGTSDYVLAIECDGAAYHSSRSARDRDRLRQTILERMNWKFYRIWSTDWYKNTATEKKALVEACKKALESSGGEFSGTNDGSGSVSSDDVSSMVAKIPAKGSISLYPRYTMCPSSLSTFGNINSVVEVLASYEAPISVQYVLKRICYLYGYEKVTKTVRNNFLCYFNSKRLIKENGFLYTANAKNLQMRGNLGATLNDIDFVSEYEIRNGMYQAVEYFGQCTKADLFAFIRNQLGFSRAGDKISSKLEKAFNLLREHIFIGVGDVITLNPSKKLTLYKRSRTGDSLLPEPNNTNYGLYTWWSHK